VSTSVTYTAVLDVKRSTAEHLARLLRDQRIAAGTRKCQSPGFVETFLCSQLPGEAGPVVVFVVDRALPAAHAV
jgi:hypothetical protein